MVRATARRSLAPVLAAAALGAAVLGALALASCDFLKTTPFPGFADCTDISADLGDRIDEIASGETDISYDLQVVAATGKEPRLLLLVEPPSSDEGEGFDYKGKLIFLKEDLSVVGTASVATSLDYFSKPYSYTHDGDTILAGYTVLTQDGGSTTGKLGVATGLEGFAFTNGTETYVFASLSGEYASFDISYRGYNDTSWGNFLTGTLPILPSSARPSSSSENYDNLGYQLVGLYYDAGTTEITFVLSEPAEGRIIAARMTLAAATDGTTPLLDYSGAWAVPASAWPVCVEADRPSLAATDSGLFLVRRDGWMEFYPWTATGTLALTGEAARVVGDRSLTRPYAFLDRYSSGGSSYMYRFDPASRMLTRYTEWWR